MLAQAPTSYQNPSESIPSMVPGHLSVGEHVALVGQNESGKTTSAIIILERAIHASPAVLVDTKPEEDLEQLPGVIYTEPDEALRADDWVIHYRPDDVYNTPDQVEGFVRALYSQERPSLLLYFDETYNVIRSSRADVGIANVLMRGRKRKSRTMEGVTCRMSVLASSQRPAWIPLCFWSESKHFYMHHLQGREDRLTLSGYIGFRDLVVDNPVEGHEFYYYRANAAGIPPTKNIWRI